MNDDRLKFRVWDKEEKCYSTACFFLSGEGELYIFIGGVVHKANPERYIVEKCTGLRDKKGKLIFEGDICLLYGIKQEIRWKDGGFGYRDYPPCADTDGFIFSETLPFTNRMYLRQILKEIEVIGTIHDNPEEECPVTPQGKQLPKGIKLWER